MEAIKKLQENSIFGKDSIVESVIEKSLWGTPVPKKSFLKVLKTADQHCICEEVGLGPKTARFKRRKAE